MSHQFEKLYGNKIDVTSGNIYYFYSYRQWPEIKDLPKEDERRVATQRILDFKTDKEMFALQKHEAFVWFRKCVLNHLPELSKEEWIVCSIPSHDQVSMTKNNVDHFLEFCKFPANFLVVTGLILRKYETQPKHSGNYGNRSFSKDYDSYKLRTDIDLKGKNVIVLDDITTSGSSLTAAKILLKYAGVKNVVCIALGRTMDKYHYDKRSINDLF